jgi:pyruvate formate lyase activating enzyme
MPCLLCGRNDVSHILGVCVQCIKDNYERAEPLIKKAHEISRGRFGMPFCAPKEGVPCGLCINECSIPEGGVGFCTVRKNEGGRIRNISEAAFVSEYYDPLPTNCVAMDFCEVKGESGKNLAVFYGACSFDCLFCQNWQFRLERNIMTSEGLAEMADEKTRCICFFGGDPTPQIEHALATSRLAKQKICFETNGSLNPKKMDLVAQTSFNSGGTIKIDIKAFDEKINYALCGVSNSNTLKNFKNLSSLSKIRKSFLVASTLLVPYYVEIEEVESIARFISNLSPQIPYVLLAFSPHYLMTDLPPTSKKQAEECLNVARKHLENVKLGNAWLVS